MRSAAQRLRDYAFDARMSALALLRERRRMMWRLPSMLDVRSPNECRDLALVELGRAAGFREAARELEAS